MKLHPEMALKKIANRLKNKSISHLPERLLSRFCCSVAKEGKKKKKNKRDTKIKKASKLNHKYLYNFIFHNNSTL